MSARGNDFTEGAAMDNPPSKVVYIGWLNPWTGDAWCGDCRTSAEDVKQQAGLRPDIEFDIDPVELDDYEEQGVELTCIVCERPLDAWVEDDEG